MTITVLMVAEKPSISETISKILASGKKINTKGRPPYVIHEFDGTFKDQAAKFKMTCVTGHVYNANFPAKYQNWGYVEPIQLYDAPTIREEAGKGVCKHLNQVSKGCDYLVLWLDCDREGENICFEVMDNTVKNLNKRPGKQVSRARFSALTNKDIKAAMNTLVDPNPNESAAVTARQIIDLKLGVSFSRFQTRFFQDKYGDLDSSIISYGPCQTPTLGFCVSRLDAINAFRPEPFWAIVADVRLLNTQSETSRGRVVTLEWSRGHIFDEHVANMLHADTKTYKTATVVSVQRKKDKKPGPTALNTVELLKGASKALGIGPHTAMNIAENLYISGYISYPRTESTAYPKNFDLNDAVKPHLNHPVWGKSASDILGDGNKPITRPGGGKDMGDHPPITPMRAATSSELGGGDKWRVYEYICRHFMASIAPPCRFERVRVDCYIGNEMFSVTGKQVISPGFTELIPSASIEDDPYMEALSTVSKGDELPLTSVRLRKGHTSPPGYLSESELIGLMEKHGIGTDASIPGHIENICRRNYVRVEEGRSLVPTQLGIVLVHGYYKIDPELVMPKVRSHVEKELDLVATGKVNSDVVLDHTLKTFREKFQYFTNNISTMDQLFEASFSKLSETGKPLSRCGKCLRYMKLITKRPSRLHCAHCEDTYSLPQNGTVTEFQGSECPFDGFGVVKYSLGKDGKSTPLCPYCYNNPPFEQVGDVMSCNQCLHPTCPNSLLVNKIAECSECEEGTLVLEIASKPNWKISCNHCNLIGKFRDLSISKIRITDDECEQCNARLANIKWKNESDCPLDPQESSSLVCVLCNETLTSKHIDFMSGTTRHEKLKRGRGGRGRGRGRGKRGRGKRKRRG